MKILTLSNCPLVESQGSGYIITNFCRSLRNLGHQVDLYGPDSYEPFQFLHGKAKSYRQALGILFFTFFKLITEKYDVLEFYGGESWLAILVFAKIPKRKYLIVSHSNGLETYSNELSIKYLNSTSLDGSPQKWYQIDQSALLKKAFTQADAIATVSESDRNYALQHNYKNDFYIKAIENPLPDSYLDLLVSLQREPVIGYCGSWLLRKGIRVIKSDIVQILIDFPSCLFKLIGVGDDFRKQEHFPSPVCSQIKVIPFVKNKQELQNIYQSLSIFILPSIYESFGLVIAEAMACGCAVVASKTGFAASLKNHEEAIVIEKPISPYLYKGVKELLMNEPLRLKIAQTGYERVQKLRWDSASVRLEDAYLNWLKKLRQ